MARRESAHSSETNTSSRVLERQQRAKYVCVTCSATRPTGVADACAFVETGQGELLETAPAGFVGALLSAPAEFVEPEAPSGALGPVPGFSAFEVPVDVEGFRDRLGRSTCPKPACSSSAREACGDKPAEVGADLANGESGCVSDVSGGLPVGPGQEPVDVPCSSSQ